jgi:hypothetical protein
MARGSSGSRVILTFIVGAVIGIIATGIGLRPEILMRDDSSHQVDWNLDVMKPEKIHVCAYTVIFRFSCKVNLHIKAIPGSRVQILATHKGNEKSDKVFSQFDDQGSFVIDVKSEGKADVTLKVNRAALLGKENGLWSYQVSTTTLLSKVPIDQPEIIIEN